MAQSATPSLLTPDEVLARARRENDRLTGALADLAAVRHYGLGTPVVECLTRAAGIALGLQADLDQLAAMFAPGPEVQGPRPLGPDETCTSCGHSGRLHDSQAYRASVRDGLANPIGCMGHGTDQPAGSCPCQLTCSDWDPAPVDLDASELAYQGRLTLAGAEYLLSMPEGEARVMDGNR